MQPQSRPSPRSATPASNPATNPERTNNSRDPPPRRSRSSVDLSSYTARAGGQAAGMASRDDGNTTDAQSKDQTRLNQIISHFHTKAALTICSARATLPQIKLQSGEIKQDRWFNILLDETDILQESLLEWKRLDQSTYPAPPLELEIFLDTSNLNSSQALVLVDDVGKRWDVAEALSSSSDSSPQLTKSGARFCEVVLERWTIQLGDKKGFTPEELNDLLPNIYKKGVVFFRSFYTFLRFMPAWKLYRKLSRQPGSHQSLRLKFRIREGGAAGRQQKDSLCAALCSAEHRNGSSTEHHNFPPIFTPSGPLHCSVEYRQNCTFGVADAESLLSSQFLSLEEGIPTLAAGRSLPSSHTDKTRDRFSQSTATGVSAAARERPRGLLGAYGSLGTFHATDKAGSPVTELRQRAEQADEEDDGDSLGSQRQAMRANRQHRASISLRDNPPFKAGSLASSPKLSPRPSPSPSTSAGRQDNPYLKVSITPTSESSKRIPVTARAKPSLRTPSSMPNETAVASSGSTSPKPAPVKYSSSFANRHKRFTSQGSKAGDSNASSGRGSSSSKEKSGQLNDGMPASSLGGKSDDDDIAAFISQIETAKDLTFRTSPRARDNVVNLAKYSSIRDTNAQLADEMSSSSLIQTSTTPPSRRLSNVPGLSTSSSPARVQPHAPFVRSRLSTHSIAEEIPGAVAGSRDGQESPSVGGVDDPDDEPFIFQQDNV